MTANAGDAEALAVGGLEWLLGMAAEGQGGLVWTSHPDDDEVNPTLYSGAAGIVITLLEAYLLHQLTGDPRWPALGDRCWHTVLESGLPARIRPGFWDNNGRCCGTAGVLALACDRAAEGGGLAEFAAVLVADLRDRATADSAGVRWPNYEHRVTPSTLAPRTGWAMGNAGIVRELVRFARIQTGRDPRYAVTWPDHPQVSYPAVDARPEQASQPDPLA